LRGGLEREGAEDAWIDRLANVESFFKSITGTPTRRGKSERVGVRKTES